MENQEPNFDPIADEGISLDFSFTGIETIQYELGVEHKYFIEFLKLNKRIHVLNAVEEGYEPYYLSSESFLQHLLPGMNCICLQTISLSQK